MRPPNPIPTIKYCECVHPDCTTEHDGLQTNACMKPARYVDYAVDYLDSDGLFLCLACAEYREENVEVTNIVPIPGLLLEAGKES